MIERRRNVSETSLTRLWTAVWLAVLLFFGVLWATDAFAERYDRHDRYDSGGYSGWRSDMLEEQRRQTELMEMQEQRARNWELQRNYEENRANVRAYQERLRRGGW